MGALAGEKPKVVSRAVRAALLLLSRARAARVDPAKRMTEVEVEEALGKA
jgi:hypothetical protein